MKHYPKIKLEENAFELAEVSSIEIKGKIQNYFGKNITVENLTIIETKLYKNK